MEPLWKRFPNYPKSSMGWRMGGGEDYLDEWRRWFVGLDPGTRETYIEQNPEPDGWEDFYQKLIARYSLPTRS
jgi:hypothetical protein